MAYINVLRGVVGFLEHAVTVLVGFVLMVIGLGLGVTMIMLPVGVMIGLIGSRCSSATLRSGRTHIGERP
jgi:hypothetical protein